MMNSLKKIRKSHHTASRTTAAARTAFSDELAKKMTEISPRNTSSHIFIQTSQNPPETEQSKRTILTLQNINLFEYS